MATTTDERMANDSVSIDADCSGVESLSLKWGSLKAWDLKSESSLAALRKYFDSGKVSASAIAQRDNDNQKTALLELIDAVNCETVYLSWEGKDVSKEEAKEYVRNYGNK